MEDVTWAVVELMGHVKLAGKLSEEERFGAKMGRLDIPAEADCPHCHGRQAALEHGNACTFCNSTGAAETFTTQYFGGQSVYRITVVTEAVARQVMKRTSAALVQPWDFPKAIASGTISTDRGSDEDDEI